MKRLPEITCLLIFTFILFTLQDSQGKTIDDQFNSVAEARTDTAGMLKLLDIKLFGLDIIPPASGVQFYKDRIIYLSLSKNEMKMSSNQISFGAIEAYSGYVADSVLNNRRVFSSAASFPFPAEALSFSRNCDTVYYTRIPDKAKKEKIFRAVITSDSRNITTLIPEAQPLDFCFDNFTYSHPALSADGKFMIFASDKTGSLGGMDLFITRKKNNTWSAPENLGDAINTSGNEYYPYLDNENNLYFSSDKLPGFGGYDIFTCKYNGMGWDKPVNLSDRINSDKDEIAFTLNKTDEKSAFFTRRIRSGKVASELFRITFREKSDALSNLTIAYIFNGKQSATGTITALNSSKTAPSETEQKTTRTAVETLKKEEKRTSDTSLYVRKTVEQKPAANTEKAVYPPQKTDQIAANVTHKPALPAEKKETVKPAVVTEQNQSKETVKPAVVSEQNQSKESVVYRVQLLPSATQIKSGTVNINGKDYKIFEYKYLGAERYTLGEFTTLAPAVSLQSLCRQAGYPQSFVVAFKNNIRSLDPALFK
jgi:hypothetical protein